MKTRSSNGAKPAVVKKTPPARRSASKTPPLAAGTKRKGLVAKGTEEISGLDPEQSLATATAESVVKRTTRSRTPTSGKAVPMLTAKSMNAVVANEILEEEVVDAKDDESDKMEEPTNVGKSADTEEDEIEVDQGVAGSVAESIEEQKTTVGNDKEHLKEHVVEEARSLEVKVPPTKCIEDSSQHENPIITEAAKSPDYELFSRKEGEDTMKENKDEEMEDNEVEEDPDEVAEDVDNTGEDNREHVDLEENIKGQLQGDEEIDEYVDRVDFGEHGDEDPSGDDVEEPEEASTLEEEHREFSAIAEERKIKKEHEIFVGGLEREATEEDVKQVFENIGEIVEVRLHKNFSTNKNKGYAFVKFANKEHAKRTLSEMKNPIICGKRCETAPSEDNDTLFLGNICNTWTKEAIRQKLKRYGIEGVESITLVPDVQHEGLSRGFAFLEFPCHVDAMLAYKRLQKPDAIFGHPERTAKVAFAEPLREPDPEIMAQVKSVFIDGLPPHWDEYHVREQFKGYGEIVSIALARNMSTARRKDYGFVDFSSHEAALAFIDGINSAEYGDGNPKTNVRARLSNPLPKTQAVKGGMCGGFRIGGSASGGTFDKFDRGFGSGGHSLNRPNFQRGRGFYQGGRGQTGRMGFPKEHDFDNSYGDVHGRQNFGRAGGRRGFLRGAPHAYGRSALAATSSSRPSLDKPWRDIPNRDHGRFIPPRRPYSPEGRFDRPYPGRHFDAPYMFDDGARGIKRPFYMTEHDPEYVEPGRVRPRLDYNDPTVQFRGRRYRGSFGSGTSMYNHDYHGSDYAGGYEGYGRGPYPPYYEGEHPYEGDHPYRGGRPYGGGRPYEGDRQYGVDRPYRGDRLHRGGYYY